MTVWFQDGTTYLGADMGRYSAMLLGDSGGCHLFPDTMDFNTSSNQSARTVSVAAGRVFIYSGGGYEIAETSANTTLDVPAPSSLNPRVDLVVVRVGSGGAVTVEILEGTPASSPVPPARPAKCAAIATVYVPMSTTTFSVTPARYTGQYTDQLVCSAPGSFAVKWGGSLPPAGNFREGATVFDLGTNQRWTKQDTNVWFTGDPGPWETVSLKSVDEEGTTINTSGTLYVRESSTHWEFSGQVTFDPAVDLTTLKRFATVPAGVEYPTQNTYGVSGQTYGSTSTSGSVRFGFMSSGELEVQSDGTIANLYVNVQLSKSPWNT